MKEMLLSNIYAPFAGKRVAVWGLGREGLSTLAFLRERGHRDIRVYDGNAQALENLPQGVSVLGEEAELNGCDLIIKSPGIPMDAHPAIDARKITSQTEIFLSALRGQVIGITGTKGKSTTTTLIYHILKQRSENTVLVGNIGIPCFDALHAIDAATTIVFELSCHQLAMVDCSPYIAVLLNIYQDHLDYYKTVERYTHIKENIFRFQRQGDVLITSAHCGAQIGLATELGREVVAVSEDGGGAVDIHSHSITTPAGAITIEEGDTALPGRHNRFNIAVAYYVCHDLFGVPDADFKRSLRSYTGLPHRLQSIGSVDGVAYYDDSISTVPETAIVAVESLGNVGSLIIGGMDRGIDYTPLADYLAGSDVENVILLPDTAERIQRLLEERGAAPRLYPVADLREAVAVARRVTPRGKSCVLSPAAASYGFYRNFEERGKAFQALVFDR